MEPITRKEQFLAKLAGMEVETPVPITREEVFLAAAIDNGGGGASSWNDLKDKPFGESPTGGDTLTWDGNTEGLDNIQGMLFKISDSVVTPNDLANGFKITMSDGSEIEATYDELVNQNGISEDGLIFASYFVVIPYNNYDLSMIGMNGVTAQKGVYFMAHPNAGTTNKLQIPGYTGFPRVKKLDEKYLPDGIGMMRINITMDEDDTYRADKTYVGITDAIQKGIIPYCVCGTRVYNLSYSDEMQDVATYLAYPEHKFTNLYVNGENDSTVSSIRINVDNNVSYYEYALTLT